MYLPFTLSLYLRDYPLWWPSRRSPEMRLIEVLLPESFTLRLAPSALQNAVSPTIFIRKYVVCLGSTVLNG
jgi:hypothetical protein